MDKYGYIGIETLLNFCENSKDHSVTPNDFMRMKRVRMPESKTGKWIDGRCSQCGGEAYWKGRRDVYGWQEFALELTKYCPHCGSLNEEEGD